MSKIIEPVSNINEVSRISTGTVIKGEISSPDDIRIDGTFIGKVYSEGRVVVGENAMIEGDVICDNIDMWGKSKGNFYVKDTLSLHDGCVVKGDLHIRRLVVELGSRFDGNCKMIEDADFEAIAREVKGEKNPSAQPENDELN